MDGLTVSIVIPVYQVEKYLCEAVDSAIAACKFFDETKCEIILVDDGSTDDCGHICDEYHAAYGMIRVIHQSNAGLSAARNTGYAAARGTFIYFLDSDDYILPETINATVSMAIKENADIVFFDAFSFYTDCEPGEHPYSYSRRKRYATKNGKSILREQLFMDEYRTAVPLMLFRKDYLDRNHLQFQPGLLHEDELFTGLVYLMDGRVCHCHKQLYARRIRPSSIMTATSAKRDYESYFTVFYSLFSMLNSNEITGRIARRYAARSAWTVYVKYHHLPEEIKEEKAYEYKEFKQLLSRKRYFGDLKLKSVFLSGMGRKISQMELDLYRRVKIKAKRIWQ